MFSSLFALATPLLVALLANAESHTIHFVNNCGHGTPTLIVNGQIVSNGSDFTSNGPVNAIGYLQSGACLFNGENCILLEMNLNNPGCPGCGSSIDLSMIAPHAFNEPAAFAYYGGDGDQCDGLGAICSDANCDTAFHNPNDNQVQRQCEADNVNVMFTFCPSAPTGFTASAPGSLANLPSGGSSSGSKPAPAPAKPSASTTHAIVATTTIVSVASTAAATTHAPLAPPPPVNVEKPSASPEVSLSTSTSSTSTSSAAEATSSSNSTRVCSAKRRRRRSLAKKAHMRHMARVRSFAHL